MATRIESFRSTEFIPWPFGSTELIPWPIARKRNKSRSTLNEFRATKRRGLSYLEVLIAAAIALSGILGAVAMFPVAILNMQKGVVVDNMAAAGPSALDSGKAMGAIDSRNWLALNGTTGEWRIPAAGGMGLPGVGSNLPAVDYAPWSSICIDARFCAEIRPAVLVPSADAKLSGQRPDLFPYVPKASVNDARMVRYSLKRNPLDTSASPFPLSIQHARLLFKVSDDLIFDKPGDATEPASQNFILGGAPVVNQRRNYMAEYEFILTLSPQVTGVPVDANNESYPNNQTSPVTPEPQVQTSLPNTYMMSAIVLHKRRTRLDAIVTTAQNDPGAERVVEVVTRPFGNPVWGFADGAGAVIGQGYNGGEVMIQAALADELLVHEGDVVMLSGNTFAAGGTFLGPVFQWYRVVGIGEVFPEAGVYRRYLTLEGSDWPVRGVPATQMTIVSGAVGVFETSVIRE